MKAKECYTDKVNFKYTINKNGLYYVYWYLNGRTITQTCCDKESFEKTFSTKTETKLPKLESVGLRKNEWYFMYGEVLNPGGNNK